jgi:transposase
MPREDVPEMDQTTKQRRARREFTAEFRAEVVELCRAGDRSISQVCRDLDLTESAVRRWVEQAEIDAGRKRGLSSDERAELARLRRENRVLREERDILKRATAFFAKETR